jgi:hypothetical protein
MGQSLERRFRDTWGVVEPISFLPWLHISKRNDGRRVRVCEREKGDGNSKKNTLGVGQTRFRLGRDQYSRRKGQVTVKVLCVTHKGQNGGGEEG